MRRTIALLLLWPALVFGEPRRHAVAPPRELEPAVWLSVHAHPLATTEAVGDLDDLAPLREMVAGAAVVALADGTHGTHEYFTTKLRIIQFLVMQMGFDALAIESSFSQMARIDAYAQGESVDIGKAIFPQESEIDYRFWAVEEFIAVADWIRIFNLTHGNKISIVGIDVWDGEAAAAMVVNYLRIVDPGAKYTPETIQQLLISNEAAYVSRSSRRQFDDALHAATVVLQSQSALYVKERNRGMALNTAWAREHRSTTGRIILWGHGEHFGKTIAVENVKTAGMWLDEFLPDGYFAIGNAMWEGNYLGLNDSLSNPQRMIISTVPADPDGYENFFHAARQAAFLLSLRGALHSFLMQPHYLRTAGFSVRNNWNFRVDLRKKFEAIVYVELTSPTHPLPPP